MCIPESFINDLQDILSEVEKVRQNIQKGESSTWAITLLDKVIKPEMEELLDHAKKGEIYFKYGKKQRMLESTYFMTDSPVNLGGTPLGIKIFALQEMYRKL